MTSKIRGHKKLTHHGQLQWTRNPVIFSVMLRVEHGRRSINSIRPSEHFYTHHYNTKKGSFGRRSINSTSTSEHFYSHPYNIKKATTPSLPLVRRADRAPTVNLPPFRRIEDYSSKSSSALNVPYIRSYKVSSLEFIPL